MCSRPKIKTVTPEVREPQVLVNPLLDQLGTTIRTGRSNLRIPLQGIRSPSPDSRSRSYAPPTYGAADRRRAINNSKPKPLTKAEIAKEMRSDK